MTTKTIADLEKEIGCKEPFVHLYIENSDVKDCYLDFIDYKKEKIEQLQTHLTWLKEQEKLK